MREWVEDRTDYEFYDGRAALEREMARTARDESFAAMHALLSKRYQDMAVTIGGRDGMEVLPAQLADKYIQGPQAAHPAVRVQRFDANTVKCGQSRVCRRHR